MSRRRLANDPTPTKGLSPGCAERGDNVSLPRLIQTFFGCYIVEIMLLSSVLQLQHKLQFVADFVVASFDCLSGLLHAYPTHLAVQLRKMQAVMYNINNPPSSCLRTIIDTVLLVWSVTFFSQRKGHS